MQPSSNLLSNPCTVVLSSQANNSLGQRVRKVGKRSPAPLKVQTRLYFPVSRTKTQVRAFLGIAGYYRQYIPMISSLAAPLTELLTPDFKRQFRLQTDASDTGIGVVLAQRNDRGEEHPILYLSKKFSDAEKVYCRTEKECAAIAYAAKNLIVALMDSRNLSFRPTITH
ncbi:retrovirus-related Pol polyprotein from transposon 297 [Trichonephila clavipes]|nr:retrovirus-related Pol polyprotein from transposon 297 [Trichonephila clavipes]